MKKKGIAKRIVALSLAASLTAGLFPVQYPLNIARTTGIVYAAAETISEAFSADDAFAGLGADSHFSWPDSIVIDDNSKTFSVDGESKTIGKRIKLGATTGTADANSISFTVDDGYTASIDVYAISSNGTTGASLNVFSSDGAAVGENKVMPGSSGQSVEKYTFDGLAAGSYYIASNDTTLKPANIYYISLVETPAALEDKVIILKADELTNNEFFTFNDGVVTNDPNSKTFDVDGESITVETRIKLASASGTSEANSIGFTIENGYKATVDVYAISSNGTTGASLNIFDSGGTAIGDNKTMPGSSGQSVEKYSFEDLEAGSYYIASNDALLKPANIYYIKVTETDAGAVEVEKKDWAEVAAPEMTAELTKDDSEKDIIKIGYKMVIGTEGADSVRVSVIKPDESEKEVKNDKTENDGSAYSYVNYTPDASGTYKVVVAGTRSGEDDKTVDYSLDYQLPLGTAKVTAIADNGAVDLSWPAVKEASSYDVIVTLNGEQINTISSITDNKYTVTELENGTEYGFSVVTHRDTETDNVTTSEEVKATPVAPEEGVTWYTANKLETQTVSGTYAYLDDENFVLTNGVAVQDCDPVTATDGTIFTKRLSAGAPPKDEAGTLLPADGKSYKLTLTELSNIRVYCKSSGDAERVLRIADENGETIKDIPALSKTADLSPSVAVNLEAGTYYLYSSNSTVYLFGVKVKEGKAPRKAWEEVADPEITKVERQEDGSFTVTYSGEFGDDGADSGRVFMYQDGFEVASVGVAAAGTASLMPQTNGDFTFKLIVSREGCADKESEVYEYNNYLLPPAAPSITWLNNLGDGKVYADWNNVTPDQGCAVLIKASDAEEFTTVAEGVTTGNYTFTDLTPGTTYTVKIVATDTTTGVSSYSRDITVGDPVQEWYVDDFGSATSGKITVGDQTVTVGSYASLFPESKNRVPDVTNGTGEILMSLAGSKNGKIADSEEGLQVYYTRIDPNTENFKLTATFELDNAEVLDNQSGFGIYAIDASGAGTKDAKYMNSVAVGNFKLKVGDNVLYHGNGVRVVTGYSSYDPTSTAGTGRVLDNSNAFDVQPEDTNTLEVGKKFTYTLEKTNDGFVATMEGSDQTIEIPDVTKVMQQEDGSLIVAVASARCDAKISNITFEKTEGSVNGGEVVTQITPSVSVFSSSVSNSSDFEFSAGANVPGTIRVYNEDEMLIGEGEVTATTVAKLPISLWNIGAENVLKVVFSPSEATENLTSYDDIVKTFNVTWTNRGVENETVYVSPDALTTGKGTKSNPVDLQTALTTALPGQTIVMLDGTYYPTKDLIIPRNVKGSADAEITLMAENAGKVVVSGEELNGSASLITIVGDYWHIYGIEFCNTPAKGVSVCGNNNVVEMCTIHNTGNSGLQISRYAGEPNDKEMWPSYNLIKNCESYDNCDAGRNDADGFAAKLTCGEGNVFYGCISHHNIDDGWDLYAKSTTGEIGSVVIDSCIAYSNGWLTTDEPTGASTSYGEGNGFKLGGENMYGGHVLKNSVSFNNYAKGITSNSCPDCEIYNCTVYNNSLNGKAYNVSLYTKTSNKKAWVADGIISVATNKKTKAELGDSNGVIYSLRSATNYFFDGNSSFNNQGVEATEDWFENVDVTVAPTRNEDGSIDMHGLLVLNDNAPEDAGARLSEDASSVQPEKKGERADITSQPADVKVIRGSTAKFSVKAEGENLTYKWQNSVDGEDWNDSKATGYNTASISFKATEGLNGRRFRCVITNEVGEVISEEAVLTTLPVISAQPKNAAGSVGSDVTFTLKSRSSVAAYQWQISTDGGINWKKSGADGCDTTSLKVNIKTGAYNGYMFRCKVTNGTWVEYTNPVKITVTPAVVVEPTDVTEYYGNLVKLYVKASGTDPQYQWEVKTASGRWINSSSAGNNTNIIRFTATSTTNGREFRCKITDNGYTRYSKVVKLTTKSNILTQPKAVTVAKGGTAKFSIKATGTEGELSYNWQFSTDNGKTWSYVKISGSGYDTAALTLSKVQTNKNGYLYRCRVKNRTVITYSDSVKLTVK